MSGDVVPKYIRYATLRERLKHFDKALGESNLNLHRRHIAS
jgi:hypothetical protein